MNIEQLYQYCLQKKGVTEHFPFDEVTLVFKVMGKMFLLTGIERWEQGEAKISVKTNPERSQELRDEYESIEGAYHMNKKHWNSITLNLGDVSDVLARELIDHSYDLVVSGLTKKLQEQLKNM